MVLSFGGGNDATARVFLIKKVLLTLINTILEVGIIPDILKQALVVPLFKGGVPDKVSSYRPISILSCVSQILKKHPFVIMTAFPDKRSTISPSKYGFLDGRGTIDLLQNFSDTLITPLRIECTSMHSSLR